jgi:hypothetical protein
MLLLGVGKLEEELFVLHSSVREGNENLILKTCCHQSQQIQNAVFCPLLLRGHPNTSAYYESRVTGLAGIGFPLTSCRHYCVDTAAFQPLHLFSPNLE